MKGGSNGLWVYDGCIGSPMQGRNEKNGAGSENVYIIQLQKTMKKRKSREKTRPIYRRLRKKEGKK